MKKNLPFVTLVFAFVVVFLNSSVFAGPVSLNTYKIGFYSGTFDPPHEGHKEVIEDAMRTLQLDFMIVVPNVAAAHKPEMTPFAARNQLVRLAFREISGLDISPVRYIFIAETHSIRDVFLQIGLDFPNSEIFQIMGDDAFNRLDNIADKRAPNNAVLALRQREGQTSFPESYRGMKIYQLPKATSVLSSTAIRNALRSGEKPEGLDTKVFDLIKELNLYSAPPCESKLGVEPLGGKKKSSGLRKNWARTA